MELAEAFRSEVPATDDGSTSDSAVEPRLQALVARGRAAHPDLALDDLSFARHLGRCVARASSGRSTPGPPLEQLEIEDLFLACACASGIPGAAAKFDERCAARLRVVLATVAKSPELRAEVEQRVKDVLLVGSAAEPPKILNYGGQGALDRWVAVVAQRQLASLLRHEASEHRAREGAAIEAGMHGDASPEHQIAKHQYRPEFQRAMSDALSALEERDRMLLRLHLVSGISVERIGKMYGVSQATASRWLARVRETVSDEVSRLLRERVNVSPDEVASLAGLVASQLDLSISRVLGPADL